jgi:acid stress-induced BolA-like protein IbaG/YrbA
MSDHPTDFEGNIFEAIEHAIVAELPDAKVQVMGEGGHFRIAVTSSGFEGKRMLQKQRIVLQSIKHLMDGMNAPVHAVDQLMTFTPDETEAG